MANGNPFTVTPLGGYGPSIGQGLAGLGSVLGEQREAEQQAKQQQQAQQQLQQAFTSRNVDELKQAAISNPQVANLVYREIGAIEDQQKADAATGLRDILTAPPEARGEAYQRRIEMLESQGRDASHTRQSYQDFLRDPEAELRDVEYLYAAIDPEGHGAYVKQQEAARKAEQDALEEKRFGLEERRVALQERKEDRLLDSPKGDESTAGIRDFEFYQNLKKENPEAADEFGRERGYVSSEGQELSSHLQKRLSVATDETITSERRGREYSNYADEIAASDFVGGKAGAWGEYLKEISGTQDAVSNLRKKYNAVKASQVVSNLPPGAASDKDIELALSGFPSDTANKQQVESFFRGLSKLEDQNAKFNNFKAEFISREGSERGMLRAWKRRAQRQEAATPTGQPSIDDLLSKYGN